MRCKQRSGQRRRAQSARALVDAAQNSEQAGFFVHSGQRVRFCVGAGAQAPSAACKSPVAATGATPPTPRPLPRPPLGSLCIPATTLLSGEARLPGAPPLAERGRSHSYRRRCCPAPSLHCPHALLPPPSPAVLSLCCPSCAPVSVCGGGPHRGRPPWPPSLPSSRPCPPAPPVAPPPPPPLRRPRSVAAAGGLPHGWPPLPSGGGAPSRRRRWRCRGRPTPSRPTPPPPPFRRDAHRAARRPLGARVAHAGGHAVWGPPPVDG